MIYVSMLFRTEIFLEFHNKNAVDIWHIFLKDCRLMIRHELYKDNNYISIYLIYNEKIIQEITITFLVSIWILFSINCT